MVQNTNEHYKVVHEAYHKAWFYGKDSPYELWQLAKIEDAFRGNDASPITKSSKLVDVGGGTGRFASLLREKFCLSEQVLLVDLSQEMLDEAKSLEGVTTLCQGAVEYARGAAQDFCDRILLKEVVHLVPPAELVEMYKGLFDSLKAGGVCLTVTRPKTEIQYPFSKKARMVWEENQPDSTVFAVAMQEAGLSAVEVKFETFPVTMQQKDWISMVSNRIWSTFSEDNFSGAELESTLEEIKTNFPPDADGNIKFNEVLVFVRGTKPK